ncbi:SMC family ATPase [Pseudonocardia sp.]|uniref:AAA family ATPase n=1 Tax=Pseudonocardia sp. TaxID=60912 RepID=UPI00261A274D|nr:SMC family ATPase [Pseudonocardia sp.]
MRPVRIVLDGVRSYRSPQEVDFSELSLFALIGDTGAGKSSIIEAMCFALYGSSTWSGRDVVDLISDGAEQIRVELTFAVGGDEWRVTRARRRRGGPPTHKLESATTGAKVDGADLVTRRVTELIGLNREQFLRAVVMPQGRFEKLLQATKSERTDILKGIFRLQSLDLVRGEVDRLARGWNGEAELRRGMRLGLPPDPEAAVADSDAALAAAQRRAAELHDQAEAAEQANRAAEQAGAAAHRLRGLVEHARLSLAGRSRTDADRIGRELDGIEARRAECRTEIDVAASAEAQARTAADEILAGFGDRDAAVTGRDLLRFAATALPDLTTKRDETRAELDELEADPPPAEVDHELVLAAGEARARAREARTRLQEALAAEAEARRALRQWIERNAAAESAQAVALGLAGQAADARTQSDTATQQQVEAQQAHETALARRDEAARADAAAHAAVGCGPGDACPICARPLSVDFIPPVSEDLEAAEARLGAVAATVDQRRSAANSRREALVTLEAQAEDVARRSDEARATADSAAADVRALTGVLPVVGARAEDVVAHLVAAVAAANERAADTEHAADTADASVAAAREELAGRRSRWSAERASRRRELDEIDLELQGLARRLADLPAVWRPGETAPDLTRLADRLTAALAEHAEHLAAVTAAQADWQQARTELARLDTREAAAVTGPLTAVVDADRRARTAVLAVTACLDDPPAVKEPARSGESVAEIAAAVSALDDVALAVLGLAATATDKHDRDAETARIECREILRAAQATTVVELRGEAGAARQGAVQASTDLEQARRQAEQARTLDEFLGVADPFLATLGALGGVLTDGRFIGYLVRRSETALLIEASRVLRQLSADRFGFAEEFKVVDRRSGKQRAPDTLSGGERFQASLALALALVEIATRGGGRLEAVFVDEGFGSLDSAALDQALTTLGGVAAEGKLVALVSHVRQVAEHVDQVLMVERDEALGSRVRLLSHSECDSLLVDEARSRPTG